MHKQTAFTAIVTISAIIGIVLWELGLQQDPTKAKTVENSLAAAPRADWSNYFEASLIVSVFIAFYIRCYASYYAINKINRALSIGSIILFAAIVLVLVKTAPCGTAYETYYPCFETLTGIAFGFALLDLVVFLVWKGLFHYSTSASLPQDVVIKTDVEAPVVQEVETKSEAAIAKEAEAKQEEEAVAEAKKEEDEKEKEEEKKEEAAEEEKKEAEEEKAEEPSEAQPLLQEATEEKKDDEKKE